ncbi:hypothetical protein AEAC466_04480 [Asticcacaulis sp. AC466]|uniref:hypothetical protein n=1 Tax=Asticcacaulis sp. AC466 TaxID=1282362 RepID=UPI0003C3D2BE|nr:hypothetical protein [Asticcacaulis sp. AC466]ESQ85426.1 hypothetical protein AEAC466_04480 [Asticcacaulis sp. AC466]
MIQPNSEFEAFFAGQWGDLLNQVYPSELSWDRKAAILYWVDVLGKPAPYAPADVPREAPSSIDDEIADLLA